MSVARLHQTRNQSFTSVMCARVVELVELSIPRSVDAWRRSMRCITTRLLSNRAGMQAGSLCTCNQPGMRLHQCWIPAWQWFFCRVFPTIEFDRKGRIRSSIFPPTCCFRSLIGLRLVAFTWSETTAPICKSQMHNLSCSRRAVSTLGRSHVEFWGFDRRPFPPRASGGICHHASGG